MAGISCDVSVEMLQLPFGYVRGKPEVCFATMLASSRDIPPCPHIHCNLLKVLRGTAEERVEFAILCGHGLGTKSALG
jgi:hypothetical protein